MRHLLFILFSILCINLASAQNGRVIRSKATPMTTKIPVDFFQQEYILNRVDGFYGLQHTNGEDIIPAVYYNIDKIGDSRDKLIGCQKLQGYDVYSMKEGRIVLTEIDEIKGKGDYNEVRRGNKYGLFWTCENYNVLRDMPYCDCNDSTFFQMIAPIAYDSIAQSGRIIQLFEPEGHVDFTYMTFNKIGTWDYECAFDFLDCNLLINQSHFYKNPRKKNEVSTIFGYNSNGQSVMCRDATGCDILEFAKGSFLTYPKRSLSDLKQSLDYSIPEEYLIFNQIQRFLGANDTIVIQQKTDRAEFLFKNTILPERKPRDGGLNSAILTLNGHPTLYGYSLHAKVISDDKSTCYELRLPMDRAELAKWTTTNSLTTYHVVDEIMVGDYKEYYYNGLLKESGQYCVIDSTYQHIETITDPATYEVRTEVKERKTASVKCGEWKRFDFSGALIEEKTFRDE